MNHWCLIEFRKKQERIRTQLNKAKINRNTNHIHHQNQHQNVSIKGIHLVDYNQHNHLDLSVPQEEISTKQN